MRDSNVYRRIINTSRVTEIRDTAESGEQTTEDAKRRNMRMFSDFMRKRKKKCKLNVVKIKNMFFIFESISTLNNSTSI